MLQQMERVNQNYVQLLIKHLLQMLNAITIHIYVIQIGKVAPLYLLAKMHN